MTLKIEVGKTYIDGRGLMIRIICIDAKGIYPVIGLITVTDARGVKDRVEKYTSFGYYHTDGPENFSLVKEYKPPVIHTRKLIWFKTQSGCISCSLNWPDYELTSNYSLLKEEIISYEEKE